MKKYMKNYVRLSLILIVTCILFGKEKPVNNDPPKPPWHDEARMAAGSNYFETFADAFKDPNILIGVFERPLELGEVTHTTLSTGEILENIPGYHEAMIRFSLSKLKCIKPIKGQSPEPIVLVPTILPPIIEAAPRIPAFIPPLSSKWVLALKKTSKEYRIALFGGEDVEKYKFINDRTMFSLFRYGHGALCLKWVDSEKMKKLLPKSPEVLKPSQLVQVPESIIGDFKAIQLVIPYTQKERMDPNEIAAITNTSKALKTDVAKSIFAKVLSGKSVKVQDPNDG